MKKLMAILAGVLVAIPFIANAEDISTNYYTYKVGDVVNFYGDKDMETHHKTTHENGGYETIVLEDKGATDEFVKTLFIGKAAGATLESDDMLATKFTDMPLYVNTWLPSFASYAVGSEDINNNKYFYDITDAERGVKLASIEDMKILGAVESEDHTKYTFPSIAEKKYEDREGNAVSLLDELNKCLKGLDSIENGFLLNDVILDTTDPEDVTQVRRWVLTFTLDADKNITDAQIVLQAFADFSVADKKYGVIPVIWFNKTADCHTDKEPGKVCYKCVGADGKDVFKEGLEGASEFAECTITAAKDCNPKTGKKSYILEFAIVAALCTISLIVVKRKDLFRSI